MGKRFSERILEFIRRPDYTPLKARKLAIEMGIAESEYGDFHDAVDSLRRVGRVVLGSGNAVTLPHPPSTMIGTFRGNPRGFGFVVPESPTEHGDLYIAPEDTADAVTGDKVRCTVMRRGHRDGKQMLAGRIVEIVQRGESKYVGQLRRDGGIWYVRPDGNTLHVPILVSDVGAKGAKEGDQVVVEIVRYPSEGKPAKGVIVERIGARGQAGIDLASIIRQHNLPEEFDADVVAEARGVAKAFDAQAMGGARENLTDRTIITIDPDDAKDYDDAISLERLGNSGGDDRGGARKGRASTERPGGATKGGSSPDGAAWELGVHIADVSTFVREGGAIDTTARERGTSVYFPGYVIPMLPELLSNGLCSLQEGEDRLCKSAFIRYDAAGRVVGTRFANTIIRSTKRLTYTQAQTIIDGNVGDCPQPVLQLLRDMDTLAKVIRRRRLNDGMVTLDLPEVRLVLDDKGRVVDAKPEDDSFTHTIIEMFMVEANEAIARVLERIGVPFIRRIHPEPSPESLEAMGRFMRAAGFAVPKRITPGDLQALLAPLKGKPEAYAINLIVLKSMQTAEYSPKQVGHFALASKGYAHFTSPIRRYADLMIHRLVQQHLDGRLKKFIEGMEGVPSHEELLEVGNRLSYLSRRAEDAEEELKTVKVLELLSDHVGEEFDGVINGVTNFGLFVQHPIYLIDGLLRMEDLGDDWWEANVAMGTVVGERSRRRFTLGSIVRVAIAEVDVSARQMRLVLRSGSASRRDKTLKEIPLSGRRGGRGGFGKPKSNAAMGFGKNRKSKDRVKSPRGGKGNRGKSRRRKR